MIDRARWILLGAALILLAVAFSWNCGGGGTATPCATLTGGVPIAPCGIPSPPGAFLQSISICPGPPPSPTPISTSTAAASPTPTEAICPSPLVTAIPQATTIQFHAVGSFSDGSRQDVTNNTSTSWTSTDTSVVSPNTSPAGSYFSTGPGCATINAISGGISGSPAPMVEVSPGACPTPTP